ncbi:MAG: hypothetical protein RMK57_03240 [Bryobacterales bacterium]|nr:hypothetical protein [Bryobacteraceae bacterium]MDW8353522.1 hypothetical protein [Bryobacterales bacterium]
MTAWARLVAVAAVAAAILPSQCVMCQRTAEAQQAERARVLNRGIMVMLVPPVAILAGVLVLAVRRDRRSRRHDG